ncbi:MAG TPA: DUF4430 domain-containing protein [Bacillota bacterium]|nr:DUF4430 domain-containing protein [Bacillota bacterium]
MKKWLLNVFSILIMASLLIGCGSVDNNGNNEEPANTNQEETNSTESNTQNEDADTVTITLSKDEEAEYIDEEEVEIEEGDILMDVLKETFAVEEEDGFITSIQGVEPEEGKAWMFFINGEMAEKGANDIELSPGDEISFDLQAY